MSGIVEHMDIKEGTEEQSATTEESCEQLDFEEDEVFFQDIELLLEHNIPLEDIKLLKSIGVNTIKGVQMTMRRKLLQLNGFTNEKVERIKDACCKLVMNNGFVTALEVSDQRKQVFKISTGSSRLE